MTETQFDFEAQKALDGSPREVVIFSGKSENKNENFTEHARIRFQLGSIKEVGKNGVQIEDILVLLRTRLEGFQKGDYRCRENAMAITKIDEAIMWLNYRTQKRQQQGVEGTNVAHKE